MISEREQRRRWEASQHPSYKGTNKSVVHMRAHSSDSLPLLCAQVLKTPPYLHIIYTLYEFITINNSDKLDLESYCYVSSEVLIKIFCKRKKNNNNSNSWWSHKPDIEHLFKDLFKFGQRRPAFTGYGNLSGWQTRMPDSHLLNYNPLITLKWGKEFFPVWWLNCSKKPDVFVFKISRF